MSRALFLAILHAAGCLSAVPRYGSFSGKLVATSSVLDSPVSDCLTRVDNYYNMVASNNATEHMLSSTSSWWAWIVNDDVDVTVSAMPVLSQFLHDRSPSLDGLFLMDLNVTRRRARR